MFDDFVEHAGALSGLTTATHHLPSFEHQGFEPSIFDNAEPDELEDAESLIEGEHDPVTSPIFELGKVQYSPPAPIVSLAVCSDLLVMGLSNNNLIMIELSRPEHVVKVPIQRKPSEMTLYKVFLDPSGRHIIVSSTQGENWYLFKGWKKFKPLKGFKMVIESIAWNTGGLLSSLASSSTKEFLIGARNGAVFEALLDAEEDFFKSHERYTTSVFSLPDRLPITGIQFQLYPPLDAKQAIIMLTTPSRIYQLQGQVEKKAEENRPLFASLFAKYRDTPPRILELPSDTQYSELHLFTPNAGQAQSLPKMMAWMTAQGIFHGTLNCSATSDDFVESAQLLPYPAISMRSDHDRIPLSFGLTSFHFMLLFRDRVIGMCNLNDEVVFEEILTLPNEEVRGLTTDVIRKTYWVYTDVSLFELSVANETRDVWSVFLKKGAFETALKYAKTASQRDQILKAQADAFFKEGKYIPSARAYAQCSASFEEISLKFIDVGEREALRYYLYSRLERTRKTDLTQRMMLATWLVDIYLARINELEDFAASESVSHDVEDLRTHKAVLEEEFRSFLSAYSPHLDPTTTYEVIQSHGRQDIYLHYASVVGDWERVVEHWVLEEEWIKAIDTINRQRDLELYYRFAPTLVRQAPAETVESWLRQPALNPHRLIPALLRVQALSTNAPPKDPLQPNHAVRYLNHVIFQQGNTSSTIHNLLVTMLVSCSPGSRQEDEGPLLKFLSSAPSDPLTDKPYYDLDYTLRLCIRANKTRACVHIYSQMGLWENSVDLALSKGDLDLAKANADRPEDDPQLRKKLWLKVAKYVVQDKKDIKSAMAFLQDTDLLKIEDILPFFPDFVVIDDFKEEICTALEGYSSHIEGLKGEMDETTRVAEEIKGEIEALRKRFVVLDAGERCTKCGDLLMTRHFYVFPCQHTFHADCLIGLAKEYLSAVSLRKILTLQNELLKSTSGIHPTIASPSLHSSPSNTTILPRTPTQQRTLLSSTFAAPVTNGAKAASAATNSLGRNILSAGDKLRDLIVPESLATVVSAGMWSTGLDRIGLDKMWGGMGLGTSGVGDKGEKNEWGRKMERAREELDELLAGSCPLCEGVVVGLDKPFVKEGEEDESWQI